MINTCREEAVKARMTKRQGGFPWWRQTEPYGPKRQQLGLLGRKIRNSATPWSNNFLTLPESALWHQGIVFCWSHGVCHNATRQCPSGGVNRSSKKVTVLNKRRHPWIRYLVNVRAGQAGNDRCFRRDSSERIVSRSRWLRLTLFSVPILEREKKCPVVPKGKKQQIGQVTFSLPFPCALKRCRRLFQVLSLAQEFSANPPCRKCEDSVPQMQRLESNHLSMAFGKKELLVWSVMTKVSRFKIMGQ